MNNEVLDFSTLRVELEGCFESGNSIEVIYFGGSLPGVRRRLIPLGYCEKRGRDYIIAFCERSGMEKTFCLKRMHLPEVPVAEGQNDFREIDRCLGKAGFLEGMLGQIARLGNLPMEKALAVHVEEKNEFESFFEEYVYGGYTLELSFGSERISLRLGYEAVDMEEALYEFTLEREPSLRTVEATHYPVYAVRK